MAKTKDINRADKMKNTESARKKFLAEAASIKPRGGLWLRQWRINHALTQPDLAAALEVGFRSLCRYETLDELPRVLVLAIESLSRGRLLGEEKASRHDRGALNRGRLQQIPRTGLTISISTNETGYNRVFLENVIGEAN